MSLIGTAELEYYADLFHQRGYARYLTLTQFLNNPEQWIERFDDGHRPLLPRQRAVQQSIEARDLMDDTNQVIDRLEKELEHLPRRNGRTIEPLKHHRNDHR